MTNNSILFIKSQQLTLWLPFVGHLGTLISGGNKINLHRHIDMAGSTFQRDDNDHYIGTT